MLCSIEQLEARRLLAAGDLDVSFAGGGITDLPSGVGQNIFTDLGSRSVAVLPDDRFVVLGGAFGNDPLSLARFTADGALDTTFGTGGRVGFRFDFEPIHRGEAVFVQPDGKILVVGYIVVIEAGDPTAIRSRQMFRFNADGTPDTTFGLGGAVPGVGSPEFYNVAIQPDGKVLVADTTEILRYAADGSFDQTFGPNARAPYPLHGGRMPRESFAPLVLLNGKIVIVGVVERGGAQRMGVVRLNPDGTPDATFGAGGLQEFAWPESYDRPAPVQVIEAPDGKLVVALAETARTRRRLAAMRLNVDGTPDRTFDGAGCVNVAAHIPTRTAHTSIDDQGRILLAGRATDTVHGGFAVVRLLDDGAIDSSFGRVIDGYGERVAVANNFAMQSDGGLIVQQNAYAAGQLPTHAQPQILKILAGGTGAGPIALAGGTLSIVGTPAADVIVAGRPPDSASTIRPLAATLNGIGRAFDAAEVSLVFVTAGAGDDLVEILAPTTVPASIIGGDGNDRLAGADGDDSIQGNAGNDQIDGGAGHDRLDGHGGRDKLRGQGGNDRLFGGDDGDWLGGSDGEDILLGHLGDDYLDAGPGADRAMGSDGNDVFFADDGSIDDLYGGGGIDLLTFGDHDDLLTDIETV